jgi:hypothetical protein
LLAAVAVELVVEAAALLLGMLPEAVAALAVGWAGSQMVIVQPPPEGQVEVLGLLARHHQLALQMVLGLAAVVVFCRELVVFSHLPIRLLTRTMVPRTQLQHLLVPVVEPVELVGQGTLQVVLKGVLPRKELQGVPQIMRVQILSKLQALNLLLGPVAVAVAGGLLVALALYPVVLEVVP